jgi:hypothetical protein
MIASLSATWLSVKCGSPLVRFDQKEALAAFLGVLDGYTLSDLMTNRQDIGRILAESLSS